jgi:hypothetical protein
MLVTYILVCKYVCEYDVRRCMFSFEISVNNFHVGPQVKMQIAAKLIGHNAEHNAEDYAHDDNLYPEATITPGIDPDEG